MNDVQIGPESLKFLDEQSRKANTTTVIRPPCEPEHVYWLQHNGQINRCVADVPRPKPRSHVAGSLTSLIDQIQMLEQTADQWANGEEVSNKTSVWIGALPPNDPVEEKVGYRRYGVIAVLDTLNRRWHRITLTLDPTPQYSLLSNQAKRFDHRGWYEMLRIHFPCLDPELMSVFRKIKASHSSQTDSEVGPGMAGLGRRVQQELLTDGKAIPETVKVAINALAGPIDEPEGLSILPTLCTVPVVCDLDKVTFGFVPFPGSMEALLASELAQIANYLRGKLNTQSVFMGQP